MKIRPEGTELFNADGHTDKGTGRKTDMTKLTVVFFAISRTRLKIAYKCVRL